MSESWSPALTIDGPREVPVLVLGHSLGSSHVMWDDLIEPLTRHCRIVRYDFPGHGDSPIADVSDPYTMADVVASLLGALDSEGISSFHVAGLSLGGLTALALAQAAPERVTTLTVMSSGAVNLPPEAWVDKAALVRAEGTGVLVDATMERWFTPEFRSGEGHQWVERIRGEFLACQDEGYAQCCEILSSTDLRPGLGDLAMPVLLVSAQDDGALPWEAADLLAREIAAQGNAHVRVHRVAHARHMSAVEHPDEVAQAVVEFLGV